MVVVECKKCGVSRKLPLKYAGKAVRCQECGQVNTAGVCEMGEFSLDARIPDFEVWDQELFDALLKHERQAPPIEAA